MQSLLDLVHVVISLGLLGAIIFFGNRQLVRYCDGHPPLRKRQRLIQVGVSIVLIAALIIAFYDAERRATLLMINDIIGSLALLLAASYFGNRQLVRYYDDRPHLKARQQLFQIAILLVTVLLVILIITADSAELRNELLALYGIIVSATIALSSTTLVGNILAGIMLKAIGSCRPGNYITVGEHFGRISEMDLLHTELQTEDRDLTTLPNLYLVTNPVRVMRRSGTLLNVELSLGYDVSRHVIEEILIEAAKETELEKPFVQIRNLGDYSITYRVAGILKEDNRLLEKRRELRARTLDSLHAAGIEIVSPTFMNTRAIREDRSFVPTSQPRKDDAHKPSPDSVVFDKAEKAESVEKLKATLNELQLQLQRINESIANLTDEKAIAAARETAAETEQRADRIRALIERKEQRIAKD